MKLPTSRDKYCKNRVRDASLRGVYIPDRIWFKTLVKCSMFWSQQTYPYINWVETGMERSSTPHCTLIGATIDDVDLVRGDKPQKSPPPLNDRRFMIHAMLEVKTAWRCRPHMWRIQTHFLQMKRIVVYKTNSKKKHRLFQLPCFRLFAHSAIKTEAE